MVECGLVWTLTEGEGIMIHLSKEGGTVRQCVMVPYINKAYKQAPVATCDTVSILGHGSRQRKKHLGDVGDKVVL